MGKQWWQQYFKQPEACGLSKQTQVFLFRFVFFTRVLELERKGCWLPVKRPVDKQQAPERITRKAKIQPAFDLVSRA